MSRIPVEHERAMVAAYLNGASARDAAAQFGYYHATCIHALKKNGIERRDRYARRSQYQLNEAFFEKIDTEEKAYWLGFIAADGCVSLRAGYRLRIKLQHQDRRHLEKLLSALGADNEIKDSFHSDGRPYCGVSVGSKKLVNDLIQLGITPAKSLTLQPWKGPAHLMRHYWRGVFDGDGCIYRHSSKTSWSLTLVGSKFIVEEFSKWCKAIKLSDAKLRRRNKIYAFHLGGTALPQSVACELYNDSHIHLDRKKALADCLASTPIKKREKGAPARDKELRGPQKIGGHNAGKFSTISRGSGPLFEYRQRNKISQRQLGQSIGLSKEGIGWCERRGVLPHRKAAICFAQLLEAERGVRP